MDYSDFDKLNIEAVRFNDTGTVIDIHKFLIFLKTRGLLQQNDVFFSILAANADPVYKSEPPAVQENQFAEWDGAVQIDGLWYRNWKIVEDPTKQPTILAGKLAELRRERNALLVASDWTQSNDSPLNSAKRAEWATYRQQLRDITKQDISAIVWPVPPSA
jgi:hypothetical protein